MPSKNPFLLFLAALLLAVPVGCSGDDDDSAITDDDDDSVGDDDDSAGDDDDDTAGDDDDSAGDDDDSAGDDDDSAVAGDDDDSAIAGDDDDSAVAGDDDDSAVAGDDDDSAAPVGPCASYIGQATPAEILATPRANPNLEALAISMTNTLTAPQSVYDRLVTDIAAIQAEMTTIAPSVATINYRPEDDGTSLNIGFDAATEAAVIAGTYTDWDCPNQWYEAQSMSHLRIIFEGVYNMPLLASEYATLPGMQYAERNGMFGGGPTICGTIDGDTWHILMVNGYGDCPSGCINRDYYYFTTTSGTAPSYIGSWFNSSGTPAPAWQVSYSCY